MSIQVQRHHPDEKNSFLTISPQLARCSAQPPSLVAGRDATPISSIGRKDQDIRPIKGLQQQDSDSHPDTIIVAPLTAAEVD